MVELSKDFDMKNLGPVRMDIFKGTVTRKLFINYNKIILISNSKGL